MNFIYPKPKPSCMISPATLALSGLKEAERLEISALKGAVILTSAEMTAMEVVQAIVSLTKRAGELVGVLRGACGRCADCKEAAKCRYNTRSPEELVQRETAVPAWARAEAGLAPDAKLKCVVDESSGALQVMEADHAHDLSDVPAALLETLQSDGCCLCDLECMLMEDEKIYEK